MSGERVRFGRTELEVGPVCFGCWQASPGFWGEVPEENLIEAIRRAVEVGVNFFDTADAYGEGRSEDILGRALRETPRDSVVIATKVYHRWYPDEPKRPRHPDVSRDYILAACDASLRRLRTDYIDLYQLHAFDPLTPPDEYFDALERLKKAGKIRYAGCSNYTAEQLRAALKFGRFDGLQPRYNLMSRGIENDLLPLCQAEEIGVLVYSSLELGLLTGKFTGEEKFTDLRAKRARFQGEEFKRNAEKVNKLRPFAEKYGVSVTQLVIQTTVTHPAITCAIVGIKNAAQIEEAAGAAGFKIERSDYFRIRAALS